MSFVNREFYVYTPDGDVLLVEIVGNSKTISLTVGGARMDLEVNSAFDLADAIIQIASDMEMPHMANFEKRTGKGVHWEVQTSHSLSKGFTIDNLNSKTMKETTNDFERLFVSIRSILEKNESYCMDVEEERLQVCQNLAKKICENYSQIFKKRK
jgi:hypothetical protein